MNKKIYIAAFLLFTLLTSFSSPAQTVIQMEYSGGVYKIPCYVNGARMKFILDTGASSVCLSVDMAEYLLENDYLTSDDFYGVGSSSIADGSVVDHLKLIIKDIEIGGLHLSNVNAIVIAGQSAPLLMGQSALQKLGSYTINGNKLVINNYAQKGTGERSKLIETAKESMEKGYYAVAISSYVKAREIYELDYAHLEHLAWCYKYEGKYKECFEVCKKWLYSVEKGDVLYPGGPCRLIRRGESYAAGQRAGGANPDDGVHSDHRCAGTRRQEPGKGYESGDHSGAEGLSDCPVRSLFHRHV